MHRHAIHFCLVLLVLPSSCAFLASNVCKRDHRKHLPCRRRLSFREKDLDLASGATNLTTVSHAITLQQQAQALRAEALSLRKDIDESKKEKIIKETARVDRWIEELLVNRTVDENTQMLNNVDQVFGVLKDGRYSQEQVNKIYNRICETIGPQSRSKLSPLVSTFVDAVGKLDELEREENPNKRWSGKVERHLRRKLFAADWGIDLEDEEEDPSSLRWR